MSYSAILFYGYVGVIGLAVWSALRYFKSSVSLSQIWCTYGANGLLPWRLRMVISLIHTSGATTHMCLCPEWFVSAAT